MAYVTVWPHVRVSGWGGEIPAVGVSLFPSVGLIEALENRYDTDAHFVPYTLEDSSAGSRFSTIPRVNKSACSDVETGEVEGGLLLRFDALVFDVDDPAAHEFNRTEEVQSKKVSKMSARADWRAEQAELLKSFPWFGSMARYDTRGGYRLLWRLAEPLAPGPFLRLRAFLQDKLKQYGVDADDLKDWGRCYRLPFVTRDGKVTEPTTADWSSLLERVLELEPPPRPTDPSQGSFAERVFAGVENISPQFHAPAFITENRNIALTRLAGSLRSKGLAESEILAALQQYNINRCQPPLDEREVETIARSIGRYPVGSLDGAVAPSGQFELGSETEIARSIIAQIEGGGPLVFDRSALWQYQDQTGLWEVVHPDKLHRLVMALDGAWVRTGSGKDGVPKMKPLKVSDRLTNAVESLVVKSRFRRQFFDNVSAGLAFANGFVEVDSKGVCLLPHSPEYRATRGLSSEFRTGAKPSLFIAALEGCFRGDEDVLDKIALIQEFGGACLLGVAPRFQKSLIFLGEGANGKSTVQSVLSALFPRGMLTSIPPQMMDNEYRRAKLAGARLNIVNELPEKDILVSAAVKAIIAGDRIDGRHIYGEPFEFEPRAGHLFSANTLPGVRDRSWGLWRRWVIVGFNRQFKEAEQDRGLSQRIAEQELAELASWLIDGAARLWKNGGYTIPISSGELLQEWRRCADPVQLFLEEECRRDSEEQTAAAALYAHYRGWSERNGFKAQSISNFGRRIKSLGVVSKRSNGVKYELALILQPGPLL